MIARDCPAVASGDGWSGTLSTLLGIPFATAKGIVDGLEWCWTWDAGGWAFYVVTPQGPWWERDGRADVRSYSDAWRSIVRSVLEYQKAVHR